MKTETRSMYKIYELRDGSLHEPKSEYGLTLYGEYETLQDARTAI